MITRRSIGWSTLLSLVLATLSSHPASAQGSLWTPSIRPSVDANSVDLSSGQLSLSATELSIGKPGAGGLTFTRFIGSSTTSNEYVGYVTGDDNGTTSTYYVTVGGYKEEFESPDGNPLVSQQGTGATLSLQGGSFIYTAHDGTVYVFSTSLTTVTNIPTNAWLTEIALPNGEIRTLNYFTANCAPAMCPTASTITRLQSVTNNLGYQIKFVYQDNSSPVTTQQWTELSEVMGINMAGTIAIRWRVRAPTRLSRGRR